MGLKVIGKVNQKTKFLARKAFLLDKETLKLLAAALVQPHFDYACTAWFSSTPKAVKLKLQTAQNKLVRVVLKLPRFSHVGQPQFAELNWLSVADRVSHLKLCVTHKILFSTVPRYLENYFKLVRETHTHATRGRETDIVPCRCKTEAGKSSFKYSAATEWNRLPFFFYRLPSSR